VLTLEQKNYIIELINEGKEIPLDFKEYLFPITQKEYELAYAGKMRKEDLLANEDGVFPVPLQIEKIFNGNEYEAHEDDWKNIIVFGDNLQFLKTIYENKDPLIKDKVKGKVKLIYIDPPFATTDEFQNKEGAKAYNDKKKGAEFVEFLRKRLIVAREILADDGIICVHLDQKMNHYIKILLDEIFLKNRFQNEIIWHYSTLGRPKDRFAKKHDNILVYAKSDMSFFNIEESKVPYSDEYIKSHFKDKDKKGNQCRKRFDAGKWRIYYPDEGMIPNDVWEIPYENSMSIDRTGYPTQKPEPLIERFIKAYTQKEDIVLDFFGGSGTTMAVAEKLSRKWITCDLGKLSYFTMQKRILQIEESKDLINPKKRYGKKAKSFITASLGSYDLEKTFELERKKYLEFVSGLFEVELKDYEISGFSFEGKKDNYPVIIYDYKTYKDSSVDENYLQDLHRNIGKKVGSRVYIIAPITFVNFVDDFVEIEMTRYYFLKIPYHIINELHKKPFAKARQPQSKSRVNDIEGAMGFHFKRPPEVKAELKIVKDEIKIIIKSFKTTELQSDKTMEEKNYDNFETLSSVFIDKTYNGKYFEMDEAVFADELLPKKPKKKNNDEDVNLKDLKDLSQVEIPLKKSEIGDQIMIVCTDIYGNDFTQTFMV